jgi:methylated-DNA-[protein]-cysteine S-methyltransferase
MTATMTRQRSQRSTGQTAQPVTLYTRYESPIGMLTLVGGEDTLRGLYMQTSRAPGVGADWRTASEPFECALEQLDEYFAGERRAFDLNLDPVGTPFQLRAWKALREIPFGETRSYGEQARSMGRPTAARAVGAANGANPIAIVVPCHRVIGHDGSLTGFGGGVDRKHHLLRHESGVLARPALS